jgi:hypothetical protein
MRMLRDIFKKITLILVFANCPNIAVAQGTGDFIEEQNTQNEYRKLISDIDAEIISPRLSPWSTKLIAFRADAQASFTRFSLARKSCVPKAVLSKKECNWASTGEIMLLSDMLAVGSLEDGSSKREEEDTVKPQVGKWAQQGFSEKEAHTKHYASSPTQFEPCISHARTLEREAILSAGALDWNGALISLRHSSC